MKNVVLLYKKDDGSLYCQEVTQVGIDYMTEPGDDHGMWDEGGTIVLDELEEILDKEI